MSQAKNLAKLAQNITAQGVLGSAAIQGGGGGGGNFPTISAIVYPGNDTAINTTGGDTVTLTGTNFNPGVSVIVNGVPASVVTRVSSTQITFTTSAQPAGSYIIYLVNTDGSTALAVPGLQYSGFPNWTTAAGNIGNPNKESSFTTTLAATGDAPITYSVLSGTLPPGITLNSSTGVLSGTTPVVTAATTYTFTIRSTDAQFQDTDRTFSITVNLSPVPQIGTTTYDATGIGAVTDISELASNPLVMAELPTSGYLKYNISIGSNSTPTPITVSYRKTSSTTLVQSAFSLLGQTLSYVDGSVSAILQGDNDDHDTLFMDADGKGVLARFNTNNWGGTASDGTSYLYTKFSGTTTTVGNSEIDSVVTYPIGSFIQKPISTPAVTGNYATIVTFPLTNSGVWINLTSGTYKTNNFSGTAMPGILSGGLGTNSPTNTLYTISDGVNQFIIGRYGTTTAYFCKVNLTTGAITANAISYSTNVVYYVAGGTEEDAVGDQLFTVDCFTTFVNGTTFYYQGTNAWNSTTGMPFDPAGKSTFTAGPGPSGTQQSGIDLFGSVDADRSVWFADWGHDNGGLYNVGTDIELGTRKTNIKLISTTYTN
jgi:hypothetical protein